jgi:hypothetical protein
MIDLEYRLDVLLRHRLLLHLYLLKLYLNRLNEHSWGDRDECIWHRGRVEVGVRGYIYLIYLR